MMADGVDITDLQEKESKKSIWSRHGLIWYTSSQSLAGNLPYTIYDPPTYLMNDDNHANKPGIIRTSQITTTLR